MKYICYVYLYSYINFRNFKIIYRSAIKSHKVDIKWLTMLITSIQKNYESTNSMAKWLNDSKKKLEDLR